MYFRGLFAACAAIVLSASVVETAEAYPITARSGTTTVTGTYRPLDLELFVVESTDALDYGYNGFGYGDFNLTLTLSGNFTGTGTGYTGVTGNAGTWELNIPWWRVSATDDSVNTIEVSRNDDFYVGTLTYLGGGDYSGVPYEDQAQVDDQFRLFAPTGSPFMQVTCENGVAVCSRFVAVLLQDLQHIGPYRPVGEGYMLDDGTLCEDPDASVCLTRPARFNEACVVDQDTGERVPCGSVPTDAWRINGAVPEPASLALVGLGLLGLAWGRRQRPSKRRGD